MKAWHAQFDEIEREYQKRFPHVSPPIGDPPVSDLTASFLKGEHVVDPDLSRAKQIQDMSGNPGGGKDLEGNWGSTVSITDVNGSAAANPALAAIQLRGPTDKAEVLTVTLGQPIWRVVNAHAKVTAVIQYGNGGWQNTAEIDWVQGTTFQLRGSFLRVSARMDVESIGGGLPATGAMADVSAFCTRLECPRQSELIKSVQVGALVHATAVVVNISTGVGGGLPGFNFSMLTKFRFMWANAGPVVTNIVVDVFDHAGNTLYTVSLANDPDQWIPLLGRASEIRITNGDAANDLSDSYLVFNSEL